MHGRSVMTPSGDLRHRRMLAFGSHRLASGRKGVPTEGVLEVSADEVMVDEVVGIGPRCGAGSVGATATDGAGRLRCSTALQRSAMRAASLRRRGRSGIRQGSATNRSIDTPASVHGANREEA